VPTVTALREDRRGRVAVELDGRPWRVLPAGVVVRAGVVEGRALDRPALRLLRRELRRDEALLAGLEPEPERATRLIERRGAGPRTARYLAARGFGEEAVEAALGAGFGQDH
jgi:hypothetical protein